MHDRPWWSDVLQWAIWGVAMTLVMGWLAKTRVREPERTLTGVVLRNPKSVLTIGLVCSLLFMAAAVVSALTVKAGDGLMFFTIFTCFALLGAPMIADYYFDRHEVDATGIRYRTTFGGAGSAMWSDVRRVRYSQGMKWFRLELSDAKVVRVTAMMIGLPEFARLLLANATTADIDSATGEILADTAAGNAPKIWM